MLLLALPFGAWSSLIFYDLFRAPNGATARRFAGAVATTAASVGPALLSASVILEVMFAWPGVGRLFFNAFSQDDLALIAAVLLVYSAVIALLKLGANFSPGIPAPAPSAAVPKRFSVLAFVACAVLLVAAFVGVSANLIAPANPNFIDQVHWQGYPLPPGAAGHVLGTDENGRDLLSRLFFAIRTSFGIAVFAAIVATAIAAGVARAAPWFAAARGPLSVAGIRPFAALPFIMAALYVVFKFHNPRVVNPIGLGLIFAAVSWPALVPAFRQSSAAALGAFADVTGGALLLEVTISFFGWRSGAGRIARQYAGECAVQRHDGAVGRVRSTHRHRRPALRAVRARRGASRAAHRSVRCEKTGARRAVYVFKYVLNQSSVRCQASVAAASS